MQIVWLSKFLIANDACYVWLMEKQYTPNHKFDCLDVVNNLWLARLANKWTQTVWLLDCNQKCYKTGWTIAGCDQKYATGWAIWIQVTGCVIYACHNALVVCSTTDWKTIKISNCDVITSRYVEGWSGCLVWLWPGVETDLSDGLTLDIRIHLHYIAWKTNYISSTAWLKETIKMTMFGVWTKLKSDGLLLTVLTETDGSLSVNHGYNCFVRETNQQKVFMCVLFIIFCFSYASKHWHPPSRNGSCLCNLFQTTVKNRFRKNIIFNYWDWVCHYFG